MKGQRDWAVIAAGLLLALSLVWGGASRENPLHLAGLELAALPVLGLALLRLAEQGRWGAHRAVLAMTGCVVLLPLIQLLPLPPSIWTRLPGREDMVLALALAEQPLPWTPINVSPEAGLGAALALLPPLAVFISALTLDGEKRTGLVFLVLALTVAGVVLGALQLASGSTAFYLYATTAAKNVVGFFANRNHLATLVLMALPLAAAGAVVSWSGALSSGLLSPSARRWLCGLFALLAVIAIAATRSRTGILILGPAILGSLAVIWTAVERDQIGRAAVSWGVGALAAVGAVTAFGLSPLMARFEAIGQDGGDRWDNWPTVLDAAGRYQPIGSGFGSFDPVYRSVEPLERLSPLFFNHAHNDYLEIWLEAGWPGIGLLVLFLIWFARRAWTVWRSPSRDRAVVLARAAVVAVLMLLLHSVVDYPVRTQAIMVVLALCLAILATASRDPVRRSEQALAVRA